jgi:hypothetical protein
MLSQLRVTNGKYDNRQVWQYKWENQTMSSQLPEMFDPSHEEGTKDLLPIGIYLAQIIDAVVKPPQSLDGYGVDVTDKLPRGNTKIVWFGNVLRSNIQTTRRRRSDAASSKICARPAVLPQAFSASIPPQVYSLQNPGRNQERPRRCL